MGVGGQHHAPATLSPGKNPVPIVQEAGWAPGPVWKGAENLAPTGIPSPDRPVSSELLYRMTYPGPRTQPLNTQISLILLYCCMGDNCQFTCMTMNILKVTNPDSTNKCTFLLLCIALLIGSYMFRIN
jgi:hypothetical protein